MKQKYEGKDLQGLVDLGPRAGLPDFRPGQRFPAPGRRLAHRPARRAGELRGHGYQGPRGSSRPRAPTARPRRNPRKKPEEETGRRGVGDSSDPVRLYLKEMGNFQLLSREQEVEIAKRIEAGEKEVEEEVLKLAGHARFSYRPRRPDRGRRGRSARHLRRERRASPIPTRSAGPRPTRSSSRSCTTRTKS